MLGSVRKRPDDTLDYDVEFERWLSDGDTITSAVATSDQASLVVESVAVFGTIAKVWLSAGTAGLSYTITVTATTAQGRIKEVTFNVRVVEC